MSIVQFPSAQEVKIIIDGANTLISDMSIQEAIQATGAVVKDNIVNFPIVQKGASLGASYEQEAVQAWTQFLLNGGAVSALGAATSKISSAANFALMKLGQAASAVGAIGSISIPTAFAAIAPLLGVGVGIGLYSLAPEFWTKVSQALLPFCWTDTNNIPVIIDSNNHAYIDTRAIDAIDTIMSTDFPRTYGNAPGGAFIMSTLNPSNNGILAYHGGRVYWNSPSTYGTNIYGGSQPYINGYLIASTNPSAKYYNADEPNIKRSLPYWWRYNNLTVYYDYVWTGETPSYPGYPAVRVLSNSFNDTELGQLAWRIAYAQLSRTYDIPGLSNFTGERGNTSSVEIAVRETGLTGLYQPIYIPSETPYISVSPTIQSDPSAASSNEAITNIIPNIISTTQYPSVLPEPGIKERTNPLPNPVIIPEPESNPDIDPSIEPIPLPDIEPIEPEPPQSEGDSDVSKFPPDPISDFPTIVGVGSGLIHVYNLTPTEFINFGKWLWVTYADTSIEKIWSNPMDGIIGGYEIYATPDGTDTDNIRSGFLTSTVTGTLVNPRYKELNCGSVVIPEYFSNYLDYSPYTKVHICLPFIGIVELNADDIIGHATNVKYLIDFYNGSCIAQITVAKTNYECMLYQYSGNCAVDVPIAGGSQASIKGSLAIAAAGALSSAVGAAASSNPFGVASSIIGGAAQIGNAVVSSKSSVQHSGTFGASYGAMGPKKPYIIVHRPTEKLLTNYNLDYGFPAHKRVIIGECEGYIRAKDVHVISATASDDEKARIEELLKSGVFV